MDEIHRMLVLLNRPGARMPEGADEALMKAAGNLHLASPEDRAALLEFIPKFLAPVLQQFMDYLEKTSANDDYSSDEENYLDLF